MVEALGPYELREELGRGGMGVVYRAVHRPTGAVRALKVLGQAPDAEAMERFRREAAALARAQGEGVVPVHELGVANGRMFLAMPLLEGGSLQQRLARSGPFAWREACSLVLEVARALERCHAIGLVHRDLKPANLLFDATGHVHLADFGCVRDLAAPRLTQTGTLIGTPSYMAPELFGGGKADARCDLYSLGALLHELVVGQPPYRGASAMQVMSQAIARKRAPLPSSAPRALEALIAAALEPEPDARIASASELAARLELLLADPTDGHGSSWLRGAALAAGVLACVLIVLALAKPRAAPVVVPQKTTSPVPSATPTRSVAPAPVDEYARARAVLERTTRPRELIPALELAVPATPATVDSALAARIVSAVWPGDDPLLASEGFAIAARAYELVAQPEGLTERLAIDLISDANAPVDVLLALTRLGRRMPSKQVIRFARSLRARVEAGGEWEDKLALSHVLGEQIRDGKGKAPAATLAEMRELGLRLATEVETYRLPRSARAAARLAVLQHRCSASPRDDELLAELPFLMTYAADLDAPRAAYVQAADLALDVGDLKTARPYIEGALSAHAERNVPMNSDVTIIRRPDRPWIAPVMPDAGPSEDMARLKTLLRILDERLKPGTLRGMLMELPPVARESIRAHLERAGRTEDAARVRLAIADLGGRSAPPPR